MFGNEKMKSKATCKLLQLVANRATEKKNKRGSDMLDQSAMLLQIVANQATETKNKRSSDMLDLSAMLLQNTVMIYVMNSLCTMLQAMTTLCTIFSE